MQFVHSLPSPTLSPLYRNIAEVVVASSRASQASPIPSYQGWGERHCPTPLDGTTASSAKLWVCLHDQPFKGKPPQSFSSQFYVRNSTVTTHTHTPVCVGLCVSVIALLMGWSFPQIRRLLESNVRHANRLACSIWQTDSVMVVIFRSGWVLGS